MPLRLVIKSCTLSITATIVLLVASPQAWASCEPGEVVIKFSHVTNADKHPKGIAASLLERRVNDEMNGKACMQVFPNSSLYDDNRVLESLLNGDVQLAAPSLSKFETFTKKLRIFDLPFLFADLDAVDAFQRSAEGQKLKSSIKRRGLVGLEFWHNGMKQMSANKPVIKPTDVKGLKFRVQTSDVLVAQFRALGANPQKMAFKEVYGALQLGVIDGQENTWANIYGQKFFEVQNGITETNHGLLDYLVVTSRKWWSKLNPELRDQFAKILREVTETRNREAKAVGERNKKLIIEAGGKIRTLTPDQRQAWIGAMKPVWQKFERDVGKDLIKAAQTHNK